MDIEIASSDNEILATWEDAKLFCFSLNINGKTGWRLPTKEELSEIYQSVNDFEEWYYWSSTEINGTNAWFQSMSDGYQYTNGKVIGGHYVRAIRSIP